MNNAGNVSLSGGVLNETPEDWDKVIETQLNAVFLLSKLAARSKLSRKRGKIINIGSMYAYTDVAPGEQRTQIFVLSTETLETWHIPTGPECASQGLPAFSHDVKSLAYWCFQPENELAEDLLVLPIQDGQSRGGPPRKIASVPAYPNGLTWSADDQRLIYSSYTFDGGISAQLDEVSISNGSTKKLAFAGSGMLPAVLARGGKLAYSSLQFARLSIWRRDLFHLKSPSVELVPSSRAQFDAQYSPDGKRIVFASARSGEEGVFISNKDGSNLVQLSNPLDPSGSPQWSPDGTRIAFDSIPKDRWEIYVADVSEGKPRKLVTNVFDDRPGRFPLTFDRTLLHSPVERR